MDNAKVIIGSGRFGKCLIANAPILTGELVVEFDGEIYEAEKCSDLPKDIADHAIQFEEHQWRDSRGMARYINHSCNPNCGMKGLFSIVTLRDVQAGEELTWDYDMTEDSDWRMTCLCGEPECRGIIGSFAQMPKEIREKYKNHISTWLVQKYEC